MLGKVGILSSTILKQRGLLTQPKCIFLCYETFLLRPSLSPLPLGRMTKDPKKEGEEGIGRQQTVVVADRLSRDLKISAVYSFDLKRAFDTAEMIAKSRGKVEVTKVPNLQERYLGDLQGVLFDETNKVNPEAHKVFKSDQDDQEIPGGGESRIKLYQHCTSALQGIAKKHIEFGPNSTPKASL
ncbi:Phosphoserine phosphatase [Handroanthus impetiginosus]|uniref:Phosphoserine phosphatase n=1 Tax=Handroanthus impetiginosus TaxID=429701 RepID=A0A2G9GEM0_9LAMI|nr:Phosphoserine phosphatase [Handroanthus impetiginosus]